MLPPSWLSWSLIGAKAIEDGGSELAGQLALAEFIARSELDRHLRRMRLRYARRRESLLAALAREQPDWQPARDRGRASHACRASRGADEPALLAAAARHNVGIEGLSLHSYTGELAPGLVLGHAHMAEPAIHRGVQLLSSAGRSAIVQ